MCFIWKKAETWIDVEEVDWVGCGLVYKELPDVGPVAVDS